MAELRAYEPTFRENATDKIAQLLIAMGYPSDRGAYAKARDVTGLLDWAPGAGTGLAAADTKDFYEQGDYLGAGMSGAGVLASLIPGAGKASKEVAKEIRKAYRANWRGKMGEFDPNFFDVVEDFLDLDGKVVGTKDKLVPKVAIGDLPEAAEEGLIYRGMSADEYEAIRKSGLIQSQGKYNIGDAQANLTYFGTDPRTAGSYANSFAPRDFKPTFEKPGYVVGVRRPGDEQIRHVEGTGSNEVGVFGAIDASDIRKVYRGNVIDHIPGDEYTSPSNWLDWQEVPFEPSPQEKIANALLERKSIRAYHGTPHDFDKFRWDASTRGTGEGAQAYGDGLYFAENEGIARSYRDSLASPMAEMFVDGQKVGNIPPVHDARAFGEFAAATVPGDAPQFIKSSILSAQKELAEAGVKNPSLEQLREAALKRAFGGNPPGPRAVEHGTAAIDATLAQMSNIEFRKPGHMYEVNINADPDAFLDWDRPLSEQGATGQRIQELMAQQGLTPKISETDQIMSDLLDADWQNGGAGAYRALIDQADRAKRGSMTYKERQAAASEALKAAGIPGIKFLDAGSRGAGDGSRNYVVFDDSLIEIARKYGLTAALGGGVGAAAMMQPGEAQAQEGESMADLARIKRNVAKMAEQGAPTEEIDDYIEGEGVTIDDVRGYKSGPPRAHDVPAFDPGVEGYNPQTGMVERSKANSFAYGAADTAGFGFGDELASYVGSGLTGVPREQVLREMRGNQAGAQADNPMSYLGGQVAGGVAQGIAAGPGILAPTTLGGKVIAGSLAGGAGGAAHGAGTGEDYDSRLSGAAIEGGIGAAAGAVFPMAAQGAGTLYEAARNYFKAAPIAQRAGSSPAALRALGSVLQADGSLSPQGQANMARAGGEQMLVDAGPTAQSVLDTAIQRSGPAAALARGRVDERVTRDSLATRSVLDDILGAPEGVTASRTAIARGTAPARSEAYERAYAAPIDYSAPAAREIEGMVKGRVPQDAINQANRLMRIEGAESAQIMAKVADNGMVEFETMPDVRQLDYITRALNDMAETGDGAGALGGQTAMGRSYQNLARDIRSRMRGLVPEYGEALDTAGDAISRSQAVKLGAEILSPKMAPDEVAERLANLSGQAERDALRQGVRSKIDNVMANVTRTASDDDTVAREALKGLKDLSSRASREKIALVVGDEQASRLFDELDRIGQSFNLRANVATNTRTYGRQATERFVEAQNALGVVRTLAAGEPLNAGKRFTQMLTGETPAARQGRSDKLFSEIAELLTRQGGAGQGVYNAVGQLGQTDQATQLMMQRIVSALGARNAYPAAVQGSALLQQQ